MMQFVVRDPASCTRAVVPSGGRPVAQKCANGWPRSILRDRWIIRASNGSVYVEGHGKIYRVIPRRVLPGLGPVEEIKRQTAAGW